MERGVEKLPGILNSHKIARDTDVAITAKCRLRMSTNEQRGDLKN